MLTPVKIRLMSGSVALLFVSLWASIVSAHPPSAHQGPLHSDNHVPQAVPPEAPPLVNLGVYFLSRFGGYDNHYIASDSIQLAAHPGAAHGHGHSDKQAPADQPSREGLAYRRRAVEAFRTGRYEQAVRLAGHAIVEMPRDGKLYLFLSQATFAAGDYQTAAAAAHQGIALLPTKDWGFVVQNYASFYDKQNGRKLYGEQMNKLSEYIKQNPDAAYARFLRGYHYGYWGQADAAKRDLNAAAALEPKDQLAARLLWQFGDQQLASRNRDGHDHDHGDGHNHGSTDGHNHNHGNTGGRDHSHDHGKPSSPSKPALDPSIRAALAKLSPSDRAATLAQRTCPVTGDILGADGTPIKVRIRGRDVFVCCEGCVEDLKKDPEKYLPKVARSR